MKAETLPHDEQADWKSHDWDHPDAAWFWTKVRQLEQVTGLWKLMGVSLGVISALLLGLCIVLMIALRDAAAVSAGKTTSPIVNLPVSNEVVQCTIIKTFAADETDYWDYTVVDTPDGVRRMVRGQWGNPGDECKIPAAATWYFTED